MVFPADSKVVDAVRGNASPEFKSSHEHKKGLEDQNQTNFLSVGFSASRSRTASTEPSLGKFNNEMMTDHNTKIKGVVSGGQTLGREIALDSEICTVKQSEGFESPKLGLSIRERRKESAFSTENESENEMMMHKFKAKNTLEKLESTAENDIPHLIAREICGESEERPQRKRSEPLKSTSTNSRTLLYRSKGKEKAFSDGYIDKQNIQDEDDSHESVESCSSNGLPWKGKERWSFEEQLIVGRKRMRKQTEESPASTPFAGKDSSFMNWISNILKGSVKSSQHEADSLPLSYAYPNDGHKNHDQKSVTCNKNSAAGSRNVGFQTIFQSIYCSQTKEARISGAGHSGGRSKELQLVAKTCGADINLLGCHVDNDKSCSKFLLSNENFDRSMPGNCEGPSTQPWSLVANISGNQGTSIINSALNKTSSNLAGSKEYDKVSSSGCSPRKHKTTSVENNNSDPLSEFRGDYNSGHKSNPHGSLWITRFSKKFPHPAINVQHCKKGTDGEIGPQNDADYSLDQKKSEEKDCSIDPDVVVKVLTNDAPSSDASFGLEKVGQHDYKKSPYQLNPVLSSQNFRISEAIAFLFARRLNALKNIILPDVKDGPPGTKVICLFCGQSGHDLCDCLNITEAELEELLKNVASYDEAEETPCLCIRCFRLNHWAVSCPMASSGRQKQFMDDARLVNQHGASKLQHYTGSKREYSLLETKESYGLLILEHNKLQADASHPLDQIKFGNISDKTNSTLDEAKKHIASSSRVNEIERNPITSFNFVDKEILDGSKVLFDAIRRLRLSRIDILSLMNSEISFSYLDGFFLRLWLGNCEEQLGGTGYYAACITGTNTGGSPKPFQTAISVSVGGTKCLVKSQHVSNNDFLENELMDWWCTTLKSGGKIPSEDELISKYEMRKELGF